MDLRGGASAAYRPALDGIRALAVSLVVVYHLGYAWLPGGFAGVDVFFVLSGYLISGLLLSESAATGGIRLTRFYARRARRLLPAGVVTVLVTVVIGKYVASPIDWPHLKRHAVSAVMYVANWDAASVDSGYFSTDTQPSPLVHFWSLAVEEQFYFVWPVLVIAGLWFAGRARLRTDHVIGALFAAITAGSLVAALILTPSTSAYYGTHTRAFELSAGGLLAVFLPRLGVWWRTGDRPGMRPLASAISLAAVLGIGALALTIDGSTSYPGWSAVAVTMAAVALIAGTELSARSVAARGLGNPVFAWTGRLSYSIYLWHWPLIVFFADDLSTPLLLALILGAAQTSYLLIEQPVRRGAFPCAPSFAVVMTSLSTSTAVGLVLIPVYLHNTPQQRELIDELTHQQAQEAAVHCLHGVGYEAAHLTCALRVGHGPTVALVGDSHATMWVPALTLLAEQHDWTLLKTTHPGCPLNDVQQPVAERQDECAPWRVTATDELFTAFDPDLIVLATRSYQLSLEEGGRSLHPGDADHLAAWGRSWDATIATFSRSGAQVGVMQVDPTLPEGILACLADHGGATSPCDFPLGSDPLFAPYAAELREVVAGHPGVTLLDPTPWTCPDQICPAVIDGDKVHIDDNHLGEDFVVSHRHDLFALLPQMDPR